MNADQVPLVSIITPSFNSSNYLEQAIQSVIHQDYPHLEHFIIDGGSTDGTLEILQRYGPPVRWISEPDEGQADAINKGFRQAQGEILGWLNADDTYQPGAVVSAVKHFQAQPEVDLVYANFNFVDGTGCLIHHHRTPPFSLKRLFYGDAIIPQASMFFRRHLLETTGGVDPRLHYVMDWEFTFRLAMQYNVKRVDETWGNFRITEGTKSVQQPEKFWPEIITILQQVLKSEQHHRFKHWAGDALFMAYLLASLEFARMDQLEAAHSYMKQAFQLTPSPHNHPAILASGLFKSASFPWHSAFRPHPKASRALDNMAICWGNSKIERRISGYLSLYRAMRLLRQGQWSETKFWFSQAKNRLRVSDWFSYYSIRLMAAAFLKP